MTSRYSLTLLGLTVLVFVAADFLQLTKAENNQPNAVQPVTGKINGATAKPEPKTLTAAQKAIPDEVAFEVFLRTVGENNAPQLLQKAGFDLDKDSSNVRQIMNDAKSVSETLDTLDKQANDLKKSKNGGLNAFADTTVKSTLARLQSNKKNVIQQVITHNSLDAAHFDNGWEKLQNYVQTAVKSQMQVVNAKSLSKQPKQAVKSAAFVKTSAEKTSAQTQVGDAYLYSTAWRENDNVFGTGTISEQYSSGTSYQVSVTVTSPSGRTNTTSGDWNYATLSNNTGLSTELENGTYNIQAYFEADAGGYL